MDETNKSPMEIALEFIADNPALTDMVDGEAFSAFWQFPTEVIELFELAKTQLAHCTHIPKEIQESMQPDLLKDACISYLNLNPISDENS